MEIKENGDKISASGGDGAQYVEKQLALMKAREELNEDDDMSEDELLSIISEKGLICQI
ncbi:MAG: hypothetical protein NTV01_01820 [Bacteroidia bacterium]|nr:hypothetical protein [Bacteroidia bacterium]